MARSKLSDAEKQELILLFRDTPQATLQLAERFGVSVSTVTRVLKTVMSDAEYVGLLQAKRQPREEPSAEIKPEEAQLPLIPEPVLPPVVVQQEERPVLEEVVLEAEPLVEIPAPLPTPEEPIVATPAKRGRKKAVTTAEPTKTTRKLTAPAKGRRKVTEPPVAAVTEILVVPVSEVVERIVALEEPIVAPTVVDPVDPVDSATVVIDEIPALEDLAIDQPIIEPDPPQPPLEVLPYHLIPLPDTCYLVVDRWSELIVRPLKDFNFLENLAPQDAEALTLPVFDNHRWAKRFSNRFQRVLKVPTHLLDITRTYLMHRGITRLLVGRQVFALENNGGEDLARTATAVLDRPLRDGPILDDEILEAMQDFDPQADQDDFEEDLDSDEGDSDDF